MRLKLIPSETNLDFFKYSKYTLWGSLGAMGLSIALLLVVGLNFGIDFQGGTVIRTQSTITVDVGEYRDRVSGLGLGDISITEVFDPTFADDQNVALVRIKVQSGDEAVTKETLELVQNALKGVDPNMQFPLVESVGPKVSGELIQKAVLAVLAAILLVLIYIWFRFE